MNDKKKVTFVFQKARKDRLNKNIPFAKDMFYTYFSFSEVAETELIEFGDVPQGRRYKYLWKFENSIRSALKIPMYSLYLTNKRNFQKFATSDHVILGTNRVATSCFPMMLVIKLLNKKVKFTFFVLGLYASRPKYFILRGIQSVFYFLLFSLTDNIIFIGQGEYKHAIKKSRFHKRKFSYIPFGIDVNFWKTECTPSFEKKKEILFVGNDSSRDFELAKQIAKQMPNYKFIFVTSGIEKEDTGDNVTLYSGTWGDPVLSDLELKSIYEQSKLTIVPMKETLQPSGQSVALQSMIIGTPVLISNISGLWDKEKLLNGENIYLMDTNNVEDWVNKIKHLYKNENELISVSKKSIETVIDSFSISRFYENVKKTINF
jgi:glycosyltransferase involved in cell wall biosynthesis